jgi:hypothetical protein
MKVAPVAKLDVPKRRRGAKWLAAMLAMFVVAAAIVAGRCGPAVSNYTAPQRPFVLIDKEPDSLIANASYWCRSIYRKPFQLPWVGSQPISISIDESVIVLRNEPQFGENAPNAGESKSPSP